jgi:deoxyribodipyrimidine photo-lyase
MPDHENSSREVPALRVRQLGSGELHAAGDYVLYWMTAFRRTEWNFALQQAVNWAVKLKKPLVVLEALQSGYRWASDRLHHFVVQGMVDNQQRLTKKSGVTYYPYLEPHHDTGNGLLAALAERACVVVGDDYPCFFLPHMLNAATKQIRVRFEVVDSNGLLPLRAAEKVFARAFDFRRFLQQNLLPHLDECPLPDPLARVRLAKTFELPAQITRKWPVADPSELVKNQKYLAQLPNDHTVKPVETTGGAKAAQKTLRDFVKHKLEVYDTERNRVELEATSGLSPYLHFGQISSHQVFTEVTEADGWNPSRVSKKVSGSAQDWWGTSAAVEAFIDQLATWRELGFNMCWQRDDYDQFDSLPPWAIATLEKHAKDKREHVYSLAEFEAAETHDELWNAAQRQLVETGTIHNYLRMLWGKKILHWAASPRAALDTMLELNNKYALDGRDPNSYSGIFWCLGRYDRPWGPERPIFGTIRYMTSDSTRRKMKVAGYLEEFGPSKK